jgi:hypothetical protein
MAKQTGDIRITGTIEGYCFYRMEGKYYVRRKSTLTGRRFQRDAAFAGSRRSAGLLASASSLASQLYRQLPTDRKARKVFQTLTGEVRELLAKGLSAAQIITWFRDAYLPAVAPQRTATRKKEKPGFRQPVRRCVEKRFPSVLSNMVTGGLPQPCVPGRPICGRSSSPTTNARLFQPATAP